MPGFSERGPSEMDKVIEKPLREYAQERFIDELNDELGLNLLLPYFEDGCNVEDVNTLLTSLPEFGAKREREDVHTRGELVMHTLGRFVAYYAKTETMFLPLAPIPLDEEEVTRQADIQERFIQNRSVRSDLNEVFAGYLAQRVKTEEDIEPCIDLLGDRNFQYHFARYLTALTRPDLLQRDRPGERPLENNEYLQEYRIYQSGVPLPSLSELERAFSGERSVSSGFDGRPWERHPACKAVASVPGECIIAVRDFDRVLKTSEAIDEVEEAYRPAIETEVYDASIMYPRLQRRSWLVACGSFVTRDGVQRVAVLGGGLDERSLLDSWSGGAWGSRFLFLFVRK